MAGWNERVADALEALQAGITQLTALLTGEEAVSIKVDVAQTDVDGIVEGLGGAGAAKRTNADIVAALMGTGAPQALALADPGSDGFSAALVAKPARACTRIRIIVGNSGCIISLDGGATNSISLPPGVMDDMAVAIPQGADVRVKRYTAGVPITDLIVEVR